MRSTSFSEYLSFASGVYAEVKHEMFQRLAVCPGDRLLDLGCGSALDVTRIGDAVPGAWVCGIDRDAGLLRQVPREHGRPSIVAADGERLPFGNATFSACRAERVLQHVAAPSLVIDEMHRVLEPGGRLVIGEPDRYTLVIDGTEPATQRIIDAAAAGIKSGRIGRELHALLERRHFRNVSVKGMVAVLATFSDLREMGIDNALGNAVRIGVVEAAEAAEWIADQQRRDLKRRCFAAMTVFIASAVKP